VEVRRDRPGDELPAELQRRESRLKRIREAKRVLEARAKDEATATGQPAEAAKPDSTAQYNFTDPESRIMKGPDAAGGRSDNGEPQRFTGFTLVPQKARHRVGDGRHSSSNTIDSIEAPSRPSSSPLSRRTFGLQPCRVTFVFGAVKQGCRTQAL
jgi:hypothetical protein